MKMIKSLLVATVFGASALISSNAAQILVQNVTSANTQFYAIGSKTGASLAAGSGFVAVGTFNLSDAQIMNATSSQASFAALLADFRQFGSATTFGSAAAFGSPSLYRATATAPTVGGDNFVTKNIYTVATSSASLAGATDIFVYKHTATFGADAPLFTAEANPALGTGSLLLGTPNASITTAAGVQPGANLVAPVPEPSSFALFGLAGGLLIFRRRRK